MSTKIENTRKRLQLETEQVRLWQPSAEKSAKLAQLAKKLRAVE